MRLFLRLSKWFRGWKFWRMSIILFCRVCWRCWSVWRRMMRVIWWKRNLVWFVSFWRCWSLVWVRCRWWWCCLIIWMLWSLRSKSFVFRFDVCVRRISGCGMSWLICSRSCRRVSSWWCSWRRRRNIWSLWISWRSMMMIFFFWRIKILIFLKSCWMIFF